MHVGFVQEDVVTTADVSDVKKDVSLRYYLIIVLGDQVTFDNNANKNYWSFHNANILPNVSG